MSPPENRAPTTADPSTAKVVRDFDFPRKKIFGMFTDPKKAEKWFGTPEGAIVLLFELDARPGGTLRIHGRGPEGPVGKTSGTVLEVVEPERFVFKSSTALGDGAVPFEALQTVTLEEIGAQRTRMTVVVKVLSVGSFPGGVASLVEGYQGGWGESLDKLQRELR